MAHGDEGRGGEDPELERWLRELRADEAIRSRARVSWLVRQASEERTLAATLAELRDASRSVVLDTAAVNRHRGVLRLVGDDVVVLRTDRGTDVVVPLDSIAAVRLPDELDPVAGDPNGPARHERSGVSLRMVLAALTETRSRVVLHCAGRPDALRGVLAGATPDVLTLHLDGRGGVVYVPVLSLAELSVVESG